jgi:uncharacterized membrane protein
MFKAVFVSHLASGLTSLILGALVLGLVKGTVRHRRLARAYLLALLVCCGTAPALHEAGPFTVSHGLAIAGLLCVAGSYGAAVYLRPGGDWLLWHQGFGVASYYLLLFTTVKRAFTPDHVDNEGPFIADPDLQLPLQLLVLAIMAVVAYRQWAHARRLSPSRARVRSPSPGAPDRPRPTSSVLEPRPTRAR